MNYSLRSLVLISLSFAMSGMIFCASNNVADDIQPFLEANWICDTGTQIATPCFVQSGILVATCGSYMEWGTPNRYATGIRISDGKPVWKIDGGDSHHHNPQLLDTGLVYWNTTQTGPVLIDPVSGAITSHVSTQDAAGFKFEKTTPETEGFEIRGMIFLSTGNPEPAWQASHRYNLEKKYRFGNTVCYAEWNTHSIYGRDATNGSLKWIAKVPRVDNVEMPEAVDFRFIINDNMLFIGRYDGKIQAHQLP